MEPPVGIARRHRRDAGRVSERAPEGNLVVISPNVIASVARFPLALPKGVSVSTSVLLADLHLYNDE